MIFPKKLKIGGQTIAVLRGKILDDPDLDFGWSKIETNQIFIATDIPEDRQIETFIHEILHCINNYIPEREIDYLSSALYQVLKDNDLLKL